MDVLKLTPVAPMGSAFDRAPAKDAPEPVILVNPEMIVSLSAAGEGTMVVLSQSMPGSPGGAIWVKEPFAAVVKMLHVMEVKR